MGKWLKQFWTALRPIKSSEAEPFTPWYTYGDHMYRSPGESAEVLFSNPKTGEKRLMVDNDGNIKNFPGIEKKDFWVKELSSERCLWPVVRFRTEFSKYGMNRYIMRWQVQPDGRYWADEDGYGMTIDSEVVLYAFIDKNGDFMGPFRIYSIGGKKVFTK